MSLFKQNKIVKVHLFLAFFGVVFFLGMPPAVSYLFKMYHYEPRLQMVEDRILRFEKSVLEDLEYLQKQPVFAETTFKNNAHSLLRNKVPMVGRSNSHNSDFIDKHFQFFNKFSKLGVASADLTREKLLELRENYIQHMGSTAELQWMEDLVSFDHWSYLEDEEYEKYLQQVPGESALNRIAIAAHLPLPDFSFLRNLALIYFVDKIQSGSPDQAFRVLRQVAFLEQTSGSLPGQMSGVSLLKAERTLASVFEISSQKLIDEKQIAAYRRLVWAWVGVLFYTRSAEQLNIYKPFMKSSLGVCSAVYEMPASYLGLKSFLEKRWPLEMQLQPQAQQTEKILSDLHERCGTQPLKVFLTPPSEDAWYLVEKVFDSERDLANAEKRSKYFNSAKVPYLRQIYGMELEMIIAPDYFRQYEQKQ